jgi:RNA polymerase sigma factor (sigma-70 family)
VRSQRFATEDIGRIFRGETVTGLSEWQLLERYLERRDEVAFEALVERHGPMVLGVCRRMLTCQADVEDAFQATFLVLVRRARQLGPRDAIGPWLHGVAARVALRARCTAARRRRFESIPINEAAFCLARPPADLELAATLDQELSRLPPKYRSPIVLCYLEGQTHEEAARVLRWPVGTVKGRLARARDLLRGRLARRGLAPSALVVTASLSNDVSASVPRELLENTVTLGLNNAIGHTITQVASKSAASLAEGVVTAMLFARIQSIGASFLIAVAVLAGAGVMAQQHGRRASDSLAQSSAPATNHGGATEPSGPTVAARASSESNDPASATTTTSARIESNDPASATTTTSARIESNDPASATTTTSARIESNDPASPATTTSSRIPRISAEPALAPPDPADQLLQAAKHAWNKVYEEYAKGSGTVDRLQEVSALLMDAQKESAASPAEMARAIGDHVDRIRAIARLRQNVPHGTSTIDGDNAKLLALVKKAELELAQGAGGGGGKAPKPKKSPAAPAPGHGKDPKSQLILNKLDDLIAVNFPHETPLEDFLKHIREATKSSELRNGIPIYVDPLGLQEAERSLTSTIQIDLEGVPLRRTLQLVLRQLGLAYFVEDGMIYITSQESFEQMPHLGPAIPEVSPFIEEGEKALRGELTVEEMKEWIEKYKTSLVVRRALESERSNGDVSEDSAASTPALEREIKKLTLLNDELRTRCEKLESELTKIREFMTQSLKPAKPENDSAKNKRLQ